MYFTAGLRALGNLVRTYGRHRAVSRHHAAPLAGRGCGRSAERAPVGGLAAPLCDVDWVELNRDLFLLRGTRRQKVGVVGAEREGEPVVTGGL